MEVLAGMLVFAGLVGFGVAVAMLIARAAFKKGWEYKRTGLVAGAALALFIVGMVAAGPSARQGFEAGRQAALEQVDKNGDIKASKTEAPAQQAPKATPASENKPVASKELSYEEWLKKTITEAIGEKANTGKPRIGSILFLDKDKTDMEITLWADDNLTPGFIRDGTVTKSTEVLRRIFSDPRAKRALLYWLFPVKDSYGQDKQMVIMQVVMTRETASKINWSGFNPLDLPDVADKFHVHPSLQ